MARIDTKILHYQAAATANGLILECRGANYFLLQLFGTVTTISVAFEASLDGTNFGTMQMTSVADNTTLATAATAAGLWWSAWAGIHSIRAPLTWTSGTNITVVASAWFP